ncbi:MAG: transcriptional repressor [Treponema sp.]|nr:transcriptional repressor [Treponema sp.]
MQNYVERIKGMTERRNSKKRAALLELLRATTAHPTAQWVHEQMKPRFPGLSLGTVYRNIKILLGEGSLASAGIVDGEERFDGVPAPHPHAVCRGCGLVVDVPETEGAGIADSEPQIPGFFLDMRSTVFYGLCIACAETTAKGR